VQLIVAEKPSVARDLARVLGVRPTGRSSFTGDRQVITWCIGHLVELDEPAAYDPRWKPWRLDTLPMLPAQFRLRPVDSSREQLTVVQGLLRDRRFAEVVNACDAGREGELIFRYVYDLAGSRLPIRRLWISSMTDEAIADGFAALKPGSDYDALADAARCRSEADWLVGLNATRAVTVRHRSGKDSPLYSIGRVQTPTLALVVARDKAIRAFTPRDYWEVRGTFVTATGESFEGTFRHQRRARLGSEPLAASLIARLDRHARAADPAGPVVERVQQKKVLEPPLPLFDLTSLQRTANRRFGLSAARTLELAQALYEQHKLLTYPRTDSRYLTKDLASGLPALFSTLLAVPDYAPFARRLLQATDADSRRRISAVNRRVFDDAKVEDHHAIIPTGKAVNLGALDRDERRIFDLVVRRFLGAFFPDAEFASTELVVRVGEGAAGDTGPPEAAPPGPSPAAAGAAAASPDEADDQPMLEALPPPPDRFWTRGRVRLQAGWQEVAGFGGDKRDEPDATPALPAVTQGQRLDGTFAAQARQTRPPPRHSEATLLAAMETAGRTIEDEELRAAMKETGLGTPATRAATIETLIKRSFITRAGKNLEATATGMALIDALPVHSLSSPELTGSWEARLHRVARGADSRAAFMRDIAGYVTDVVAAIRSAPVNPAMSATAAPPSRTGPPARASGRPDRDRPRDRDRDRDRVRKPRAARPPPAAVAVPDLQCPRCRQGQLVTGKRGWGCSRWREGCPFVVWFEVGGRRLSHAQLRELVEKGKTRKSKWARPEGEVSGRLVLDLGADATRGAARLEIG
jgi:DNA topoisomerase-3